MANNWTPIVLAGMAALAAVAWLNRPRPAWQMTPEQLGQNRVPTQPGGAVNPQYDLRPDQMVSTHEDHGGTDGLYPYGYGAATNARPQPTDPRDYTVGGWRPQGPN